MVNKKKWTRNVKRWTELNKVDRKVDRKLRMTVKVTPKRQRMIFKVKEMTQEAGRH